MIESSSAKDLMKFMEACGFEWICGFGVINGVEEVASKVSGSNELWWRPIEVEGSGFTQLFKGSFKAVARGEGCENFICYKDKDKISMEGGDINHD